MRRQSSRQAKAAAKARMSGGIPSLPSPTKLNKKIVFGDNDDAPSINDDLQHEQNIGGEEHNIDGYDGSNTNGVNNNNNEEDDDDDAVEEVKGTSARKTTQKIRDEERKIAKETSIVKKKRKKKNDIVVEQQEEEDSDDSSSSDSEGEKDDDMLTEDFFKQVDTQRANQLQLQKQEKKQHKIQLKKRLGKHTTFVVEDEYKMGGDTPHRTDQTNIEVVPIGGSDGGGESSYNATTAADQERQLLISATLGSAPSRSSTLFARGSLSCGVSKERGSGGRKRKTKDEETWKRSRKTNRLGVGSRVGQAATLFVCKKKKKK